MPRLFLTLLLAALLSGTLHSRTLDSVMLKQHEQEQRARWAQAVITPLARGEVRRIVDRAIKWWPRYEAVSSTTRVPSATIAVIHNMECGQKETNLCNGDSLARRTWQVPAGRPPPPAKPPFTWEFAATDALLYDRLDRVDWHDLGAALNAIEGYNGWGYLLYHKRTPSPYITGGTTAARPGKYVKDGVWSPTALSDQIGAIAIWKELQTRGWLHAME